MPAEWHPHERTLVAWPCREESWRGIGMDAAMDCHARVVDAISQFEPVTLVANPGAGDVARRSCPEANVELIELPIDDSWFRDSGPIIVKDESGDRLGVDFGFNSWGQKFTPYDRDAAIAGLLLTHLGIERKQVDLVLEGGSIAVDGDGLLVTTEQCNLNPNRNAVPSASRLEEAFGELLGVSQTIWLERGLAEDADTDGHVDNICAFYDPGKALLQTAPVGDPNQGPMAHNRAILEESGVEVTPIEMLPRTTREGTDEPIVIPYTNFYVCNGAVVVPVAGLDPHMDSDALKLIGSLFPGREVVGVEALTLAFGGGGIHCITQQVPA